MLFKQRMKLVLLVVVALLLAVIPASAKVTAGKGYQDIDANQLKKMMDAGDPLVVFPLSGIEFNDLHITGSVNIPLSDLVSQLPADRAKEIVFYCLGTKCTASWRAAEKAVEAGYKNVYAFREGLPAWVAAGYPTVSTAPLPQADINKISTDKLEAMLAGNEDFILLDVCLKQDAEKFWIDTPNRVHIPLDDLDKRLSEIPKGKKIAVICLKGKRSPTAIRYLVSKGYKDVVSIEGGMQKWILDGKPIKTS